MWGEVAWLSVGQLASTLGAVVGIRVVTSLLSPEAFGQLALGLTVATLVSQVALGPLSNAAERFFLLTQATQQIPEFFMAIRRLTLRTSGGILLLGGGLCVGVGIVNHEWLLLALAAVAFALLSGWDKILSGIQNAARQRATVAWHQALREWLKTAFAAAALLVLHSGAAALVAYSIACLCVLGSQFFFLQRARFAGETARAPHRGDAQQIGNRMVTFALPFAIWGTFTWAQVSSDRWALQLFGQASSVGLYTSVYQIGAYPLTILTGLLLQLIAPVLFSQVGDGRSRTRVLPAVWNLVLLCCAMLGITLLACVVSFVAHGAIFGLLVGAQYGQVSYLLPFTILSSGIFNTGQLASLVPLMLGDSRSLLVPTLATAVLSVLMNLVGAYLYGIQGVIAAEVVFSVVYALAVACVAYRRVGAVPLGADQT